MMLHIQDPFSPPVEYLLEAIIKALPAATDGAAAFAFASAEGVNLLLGDKEFAKFANQRPFDLIIGLDAVTDTAAIECLKERQKELPRLLVRAFLHNKGGAIFHPKVCWFRNDAGGLLIAGSGNLTRGGLRGNWEAYSSFPLNKAAATKIESSWNQWKQNNQGYLKSLTDPEVEQRAQQNTAIRQAAKAAAKLAKQASAEIIGANQIEDEPEVVAPASDPSDAVLLAEIPKASERWNQANFDLATFTDFFQVKPGGHQRIALYHVKNNGSLGPVESRPSVSVKSQNYRFELAAAAGLHYPSNGRPVGVFLRLATRTFKYQLLMPGDAGHAKVDALLTTHYSGRKDRVRRVVITATDLRKSWPDAPVLK